MVCNRDFSHYADNGVRFLSAIGIRLMIIAKINEKYQITIPRNLRDLLGMEIGDTLYCTHRDGVVDLSPKIPDVDESPLHVTIRERFQITLPIKKLHIRIFFSDPIVRIEQRGDSGLCIWPIDLAGREDENVIRREIRTETNLPEPWTEAGERRRRRRKSQV